MRSRGRLQETADIKSVVLTQTQSAIVVGSLLGDGAMRCKTNALLEVNHSAAQAIYVDWKYRNLVDLVRTPPKKRNGNGKRVAYRFVTRSLPELTPFYRDFYKGGKKCVPDNLELTPLALAVWFMDDGCKSRTSGYLNTQQFSEADQERLLVILLARFGICATLNRDKAYKRIRLAVRSVPVFVGLVTPYVLSAMRYKLPIAMTQLRDGDLVREVHILNELE